MGGDFHEHYHRSILARLSYCRLILRHKSQRSAGAGHYLYHLLRARPKRDNERESRRHLRRNGRIRCGIGSVRFGRLGQHEVATIQFLRSSFVYCTRSISMVRGPL
jgi:hypothetical protein